MVDYKKLLRLTVEGTAMVLRPYRVTSVYGQDNADRIKAVSVKKDRHGS